MHLPHLDKALEDIRAERQRQEAKFPDQHLPDIVLPDHVRLMVGAERADRAAELHNLPTEGEAKAAYELQVHEGCASWLDVLIEEVAETVQPAVDGDLEKLRAELVQVAAVAVRQIEDIDRRRAAGEWGVEFRNGGWVSDEADQIDSAPPHRARRFATKEDAEVEARQWAIAGGMAKRIPSP